jgi:hypothetical protein
MSQVKLQICIPLVSPKVVLIRERQVGLQRLPAHVANPVSSDFKTPRDRLIWTLARLMLRVNPKLTRRPVD